jgi:hypothetical protein
MLREVPEEPKLLLNEYASGSSIVLPNRNNI